MSLLPLGDLETIGVVGVCLVGKHMASIFFT